MDNTIDTKEFDLVVNKAKGYGKPARLVIASAECPNILEGAVMAKKEGIADPILIGNHMVIRSLLKDLGESDDDYKIISAPEGTDPVQFAIDKIKAGEADILMRGNTGTRDFLMPILDKKNKLLKNKLFTQVDFFKIPGMSKTVAISDTTLLVSPSTEQHREVIKNMVKALKILGVDNPNIALLSLVEVPSLDMKDTLEAANLVYRHQHSDPIAECNLVGPIPYDLIVSKEAAKLKGYDCDYCGEFDGIVVPDLKVGNIMIKVLEHSAGSMGFGVIMGANVPIAITSRSDAAGKAFLSIAAARIMLENIGSEPTETN
ncbi:MAG: hypothetical protein HUJ76_01120 [Parasporobacterium sp.]|nr:hypothetical protein [Parasporobacterium sp.]